jgi:hypothetical protein
VSQVSFTNNGARRMVTTKSYDLLNRLTSIASSNAKIFPGLIGLLFAAESSCSDPGGV